MWSVVLGGSSGIGLECVKELAKINFNLFIVHRDGRIATKSFLEEIEKIKALYNIETILINTNANTPEGQNIIKEELLKLPQASIKVFVHSIADGHIKPLFSSDNNITEEDFIYTLNSMGVSFYTWSKFLFDNKLFTEYAYIFGITSEGSRRVIKNYAAVGAAKAVLETLCKYMAYELAPHKILVNLLCPGVVKTKAIRIFPEVEKFISEVENKNPFNTLTQPEYVAEILAIIVKSQTKWLTGEIIHIDGGEQNVF